MCSEVQRPEYEKQDVKKSGDVVKATNLGGDDCGGRTEVACSTTTIEHLFPEILTEIFQKLSIKDLGSVARTCKLWNQILLDKRLWRGVEAKIHLKKSGNQAVYQTLHRRGIQNVQVLSLKRSLRELTTSLPGIRSLKLSGCYNVTDGTVSSGFSMRLENLTVLNLSLCKQVSDFSLGRIAMMAVNLESLDLGGCCQISNRGLFMISWGLKKLSYLNLRSCYLINDIGIGFLAGVVNPTHFQDPRLHDFLVKFGLLEGSQSSGVDEHHQQQGSLKRRAFAGEAEQQPAQVVLFQQQQPPVPMSAQQVPLLKKTRFDSTTLGLPMPVAQQCAICKQDIPMYDGSHPRSSRSRKRGRQQFLPIPWSTYPGYGPPPLPSNPTSNNNNNSNNINGSNGGSSSSSSSSSSNSEAQSQPLWRVEKISSSTEFGNKFLQELILQDCQKLSDDCLFHLTNLPRLKGINLSFCVHITDSGLKNLGSCPSLCEINLRACDNITDSGLANLAYDLSSRVTSLDVSFCDKIRNNGLNYIAQFGRLRVLSMSACEFSDEGLVRVASSLRHLETLNIGQCGLITDESLKVIGEKCQDLKYIDLYGCGKITTEGLAMVMKLPNLKNLNLGLWHLR